MLFTLWVIITHFLLFVTHVYKAGQALRRYAEIEREESDTFGSFIFLWFLSFFFLSFFLPLPLSPCSLFFYPFLSPSPSLSFPPFLLSFPFLPSRPSLKLPVFFNSFIFSGLSMTWFHFMMASGCICLQFDLPGVCRVPDRSFVFLCIGGLRKALWISEAMQPSVIWFWFYFSAHWLPPFVFLLFPYM